MWHNNEPSVLDYARFHGLTTDYRLHHPFAWFAPQTHPWIDSNKHDLIEITEDFPLPTAERFSVTKDGALLLSAVTRSGQSGLLTTDNVSLPKFHRAQDLKCETPLLHSDHTLDLHDFRGPIMPILANVHFPREKVDNEQDEGLEWPSSYGSLHLEVTSRSLSEKLGISKNVLLYLQDALRQHEPGDASSKLDMEPAAYKRRVVRDQVTPPLFPLSPEVQPFVPSSDVGHIDLLSELTSPTKQEIVEIEQRTNGDNEVTLKLQTACSQDLGKEYLNSDDIASLYSPLKDMKVEPPLPSFHRQYTETLKVDSPLTPRVFDRPLPWGTTMISPAGAFQSIVPNLPSPIPRPEENSSEDIEQFLAEIVRPLAGQAEQKIEQEQLQEADTTRRIKVPIMDFSKPLAPWDRMKQQAKGDYFQFLFTNMNDERLKSRLWTLSGKAERALQWTPFPAYFAKAVAQESIEGIEILQTFIAQPEMTDNTSLTWKIAGIRAFGHSEVDSDELEYGDSAEATNLRSLLKKRHMILHQEEEFSSEREIRKVDEGRNSIEQPQTCEGVEGPFSALDAIDSFMAIRVGKAKRRKLEKCTYFPDSGGRNIGSDVPKENACPTATIQSKPASPSSFLPLPMPKLIIPDTPVQFVVATAFLTNRSLFRRIQDLFPTAEFFERELLLHLPHRNMNPEHHSHHLERPNRLTGQEADIVLSPSVGLILTTFQKIAQRSLPGTTALSPLFTRILYTAPRYESLIILVTEVNPRAPVVDLNANLTPLLDLHAFCASLALTTAPSVVYFPPDPSEVVLATYIVHLMLTHRVEPAPSSLFDNSLSNRAGAMRSTARISLNHEETNWEIFLRRANVNAFAAQVVLGILRSQSGTDSGWIGLHEDRSNIRGCPEQCDHMSHEAEHTQESGLVMSSKHHWRRKQDECGKKQRILCGLAAFVCMSGEERITRFEGSLGGKSILERAGRALDLRWGSGIVEG